MKHAAWIVLIAGLSVGCDNDNGRATPVGEVPNAAPAPAPAASGIGAFTQSAAAGSAAAGPAPTATATASAASVPAMTGSAGTVLADARPLYYERAITEDDLRGRTLRELSLLRNTIYARAGNPFRRPWLHAHFRAQPWYRPLKTMDARKISALDKANARKIADHDAAITQEQLKNRRDEVLARRSSHGMQPDDEVELSLLSQRLGIWLGERAAGAREPTPLEDQALLDRIVSLDQLSTLSRRDLRILRNTIYARRGRSFDSAVVRGYFAAATWYKPRRDYDDSLLTAIDNKNIAMVRSVEASLGGPLHENPDYGKDGWFSAA